MATEPLKNTQLSTDPSVIGLQVESMNGDTIPNDNFFVRSHSTQPIINMNTWKLDIFCDDTCIKSLNYDQILSMPSTEFKNVLECAGNSRAAIQPPVEGLLWDNSGVSSASWTGVSVSQIIEGLDLDDCVEIAFIGADTNINPSTNSNENFGASLPIEKALLPEIQLVHSMNGEPLPASHGYPLRLIVPGWYGMASVKWVTEIRLLSKAYYGFHQSEYYVYQKLGDLASDKPERVTTMQVKSLITAPNRGQSFADCPVTIKGKAWTGAGSVSSVEITLDEGQTWHAATLQENDQPRHWTSWEYTINDASPGYYIAQSRASDSEGNIQPLKPEWNFRGFANNGIHGVPFRIKPI
ncbi:MAG: sulfite oxidase [Dehalococcoidia bacterium]|tara:strand:- start:10314 stop:11372 length:1059 start_codon:yes stop_codon:yes gene_type:complete